MSETIWWCMTHKKQSSHEQGRCTYVVMMQMRMKLMQMRPEEVGGCRMVERRLVSPTALVIERDEALVEHIVDFRSEQLGYTEDEDKEYVRDDVLAFLDALASDRIRVLEDSDSASSQGVED